MKKYTTVLLAFLLMNIAHAQSVAAGQAHSIFLCQTQSPVVSGWNFSGVLGIGSDSFSSVFTPTVLVGNPNNISKVYAGKNTTFLLNGQGDVLGCGQNVFGQLGDGTLQNRTTLVQVNISDVVAVAAGNQHTLFLKSDGTVWSTGYNPFGPLGFAITGDRITIPTQIPTLSGIVAISAGGYHSLFLKDDGTVWACGLDGAGQLGTNGGGIRIVPVQTSITNVSGIAAGQEHSLFVKADGTAWACGKNGYGELGDGTTVNRNLPVAASGMSDVSTVITHCSSTASYFLKTDGTVLAAGTFFGSQDPNAPILSAIPVPVGPIATVREIGVGMSHALFVTDNQTVWGAGTAANGEMGTSDFTFAEIPTALSNICNLYLKSASLDHPIVGVFPNPVASQLQINTEVEIVGYNIFNLQGINIKSITTNEKLLDVSFLSSGIYLLRIDTTTGGFTERFIKK